MEEDSSPSDTWKDSEITHQAMQPRGSKMDRWGREKWGRGVPRGKGGVVKKGIS